MDKVKEKRKVAHDDDEGVLDVRLQLRYYPCKSATELGYLHVDVADAAFVKEVAG